MSNDADVLIIGAGAAGLAAAREFAPVAVRSMVLEARTRIGGRIYTVRDQHVSTPIELGAEFVHGAAPITRQLVQDGRLTIYEIAGERWRSERSRLARFDDFWERLDRLMRLLDEPRSRDRSFAAFLAEKPGGRTLTKERSLASQWVRGFHAANPADASAAAIASGGSPGEDQAERTQARILQGYSTLVDFLARDVPNIRLGVVVSRITWTRGAVVVTALSQGNILEFTGRAAIITCPLPVLHQLAFDPPLPRQHREALDQLAMGQVIRVTLVLDEPFWTRSVRAAKRSLHSLTFLHPGDDGMPVCWTSYPVETPVITAWFGFPDAIALAAQSPKAIEAHTIRAVARLFHMSRRALERRVRACYTHNWTRDPFALVPIATPASAESTRQKR